MTPIVDDSNCNNDDALEEELESLVAEIRGPTPQHPFVPKKATSSSSFRNCWLLLGSLVLILVSLDLLGDESLVQQQWDSAKSSLRTNAGESSSRAGNVTNHDTMHGLDVTNISQLWNFIQPGLRPHPSKLSIAYSRRARPTADWSSLQSEWGAWTLMDAQPRPPLHDVFASTPHRDVPFKKIPPTAWQRDPDYLLQFFAQAEALLNRSVEAILAEYGHGLDRAPGKTLEERSLMFTPFVIEPGSSKPPASNPRGGWTTQASLQGLCRRLLHALVTQDTFTLVMGGHSSAAGHGNHFVQSYTLQVTRILQPILARLGVHFEAHNFGMGGLGTMHNALGMKDLYGKDIDFLIWDSGMTEHGPPAAVFSRQALLSGNRVPMLWNAQGVIELHQVTGVEVGGSGIDWNTGYEGIPEAFTQHQLSQIPWASRYERCGVLTSGTCRTEKYNTSCWIDREDHQPFEPQQNFIAGQAKWHPGFRHHQKVGRNFAFIILRQLQNAIQKWKKSPDFVLADEEWHMGEHYASVQAKTRALDAGPCTSVASVLDEFCVLPLHARSEFLPRAHPGHTSIRSILRSDMPIFWPKHNEYDPPDVYNPAFDPPSGEVDVLAIVENGVDFVPHEARIASVIGFMDTYQEQVSAYASPPAATWNTEITPGRGFHLDTQAAPDNCDGTYDSFCGRDDFCLLSGMNDHRGGIVLDSYSGWLIMNLEQVQKGFITVKFEDWHPAKSNPATEGWCSINNETACAPETRDRQHRGLSGACSDFRFEYAINGQISSWDATAWKEHEVDPQRVVQMWVLLNDRNFVPERSTMDVEVALRITGCQRDTVLKLTHIYWA